MCVDLPLSRIVIHCFFHPCALVRRVRRGHAVVKLDWNYACDSMKRSSFGRRKYPKPDSCFYVTFFNIRHFYCVNKFKHLRPTMCSFHSSSGISSEEIHLSAGTKRHSNRSLLRRRVGYSSNACAMSILISSHLSPCLHSSTIL